MSKEHIGYRLGIDLPSAYLIRFQKIDYGFETLFGQKGLSSIQINKCKHYFKNLGWRMIFLEIILVDI